MCGSRGLLPSTFGTSNRSWILHPPGTKSKQPVVGVAVMVFGVIIDFSFGSGSKLPVKFGSRSCLTRILHDISHPVSMFSKMMMVLPAPILSLGGQA